MSELIVLAFDAETGAADVSPRIEQMQADQVIQLEDAAILVRKQNGQVVLRRAEEIVGEGTLGPEFWGLLIGTLFFLPWLGLKVATTTNALTDKYGDIGLDETFLVETANQIEPGNSAFFLYVRSSSGDEVIDHLQEVQGVRVLKALLTPQRDSTLRIVFGGPVQPDD